MDRIRQLKHNSLQRSIRSRSRSNGSISDNPLFAEGTDAPAQVAQGLPVEQEKVPIQNQSANTGPDGGELRFEKVDGDTKVNRDQEEGLLGKLLHQFARNFIATSDVAPVQHAVEQQAAGSVQNPSEVDDAIGSRKVVVAPGVIQGTESAEASDVIETSEMTTKSVEDSIPQGSQVDGVALGKQLYELACNGDWHQVREILEGENGHLADVSTRNNALLLSAVQFNKVDIVRLLLANPTVDPTDRVSKFARVACKKRYTEMLRLLQQDGRTDFTECDNWVLQQAVKCNSVELVRIVLAAANVQASYPDNKPLEHAAYRSNTEIIRLLCEDEMVRKLGGKTWNKLFSSYLNRSSTHAIALIFECTSPYPYFCETLGSQQYNFLNPRNQFSQQVGLWCLQQQVFDGESVLPDELLRLIVDNYCATR